jgi:CelD/BcsL family acetyltransferase involved in cellulose biosynthesis
VETARTEEEVERLRDWWEHLPVTDVDANLDYFLTVVRTDPTVRRPHVMRITPAGEQPVLVVARLVDQAFGATLSGARTGSVSAPALVVSFGGVVGASSATQRSAALSALEDALAAREADVVVLQKTDRASEWFHHLVPDDRRWRVVPRPAESSWTARLPDSWEALLAARSSKSRRQIRFDDNKLRRVYGDRLCLRRLDLPEHQHRMAGDVAAVARKTYQHGLGVSLLDGGVQGALSDLAREKGWLRVWMLYVDEQPVAFWWGITHAGVLSIGSPGYLPEFSKDRVGYYVLRRMLEDAADDPATRVIDFGTGDADYKERFGDLRSEVSDVLLFARRPRAVAVRAFLALQERGVALGRAGVARAGWTEDLRRWWRHRNLSARAARADA